jgi:IclR family acetate operon transcriptional repressor
VWNGSWEERYPTLRCEARGRSDPSGGRVLPSRLAGDSRIVRTPTPTTARDRPPEEAAEDTSFARGLRLLLMVADRGGIRADELGSLLEMPVSTVYRYLRTLADFGFVDRHGGQYRLGPKLLIGTGANVSSERLIRHADAPLRMLAHETGETGVVVRRIGLSSICLHQIESDAPLRVTLGPGEMSPLYAGAPGRALLAFAPSEVLDEVLAQDLVRITNRTPTEPELRASLGGIVMTGMAISEGELIEGSVAMAAPVFREDGIVGAIAVIGPAFRCGEAWRARSAKLLQEAGRAINAALAEDGSQ